MKDAVAWILSIALVTLFLYEGPYRTEFSRAFAFVLPPLVYRIYRTIKKRKEKTQSDPRRLHFSAL